MKLSALCLFAFTTLIHASQGWLLWEGAAERDVAELKAEVMRLTHRVRQLEEKELADNQREPEIRVEDLIAFTANGHNNASCVENEPAMFNRTVSNPGDYYNEANSSFTVPIDGLYVFTLNVHSRGDEELSIHIMRDDESMVGARVFEHGDSATNTVVRSLQSGTVIWTKCMSNGQMYQGQQGKHNTFSGYLVRLA